MRKDGAYLQAYNTQIIVDEAHQVIIAHGVSSQPPDQEYLVPMVGRMVSLGVEVPKALLADSGYFSMDNVQALQDRGIDPYIAVSREGGTIAAPPTAASTPAQSVRALMREKLNKGEGKAIYSRRKVIVEPVFGQIEQARRFRRFSQRGRMKVQREWALVCLTHNLLKPFAAPVHSVAVWNAEGVREYTRRTYRRCAVRSPTARLCTKPKPNRLPPTPYELLARCPLHLEKSMTSPVRLRSSPPCERSSMPTVRAPSRRTAPCLSVPPSSLIDSGTKLRISKAISSQVTDRRWRAR